MKGDMGSLWNYHFLKWLRQRREANGGQKLCYAAQKEMEEGKERT